MMSRQIYRFVLQAETPLYFGSAEARKLLMHADGSPFVTGNAIGGLLREWIKNNKQLLGIDPLDVMGDEVTDMESNQTVFRESAIQIDDGQITSQYNAGNFPKKNGTAIDPQTGTALSGQNYAHEYLPAGTKIQFEVSCDISDLSLNVTLTKEKLQHLMTAWAAAIDQEEVRFGGKKSQRFGVCKVESIIWEEYDFSSASAIDDYLFDHRPTSEDTLNPTPIYDAPQIYKMRMDGSFPYGVYTADFEKILSDKADQGKQQVWIPSSSLKGVIRHEVRRLVIKILHRKENKAVREETAEKKAELITNELFGSTDQPGIIIVHDLHINGKEVQVIRAKDAEKNPDFPYAPKYVMIDRITGGAVESQLRTQREVQGDGTIILEIRPPSHKGQHFDKGRIWFPLIYVLRRIGAGILPIGGKTSIGLGAFHADELRVEMAGDDSHTHVIQINGHMKVETAEWLRESYDRFREWCFSEMD